MEFGFPNIGLRWRRAWLAGLAAAVMVAGAALSRALEPTTPLGRLGRQVWTMENGLPQNTVPVLLQGRSGFLWVGTELGLARFDGVGFRVLDRVTAGFPDAEVRCLLDAPEAGGGDALWVGTGDGLVRWRNGRAEVFTVKDGLPGNSIRGLVQGSDGMVWVWTEAGLARWDGSRFSVVSEETGSPRGGINSIAADSAGGVWVGTTAGVALFRDGHWQSPTLPVGGAALVARIAGGDVLISSFL